MNTTSSPSISNPTISNPSATPTVGVEELDDLDLYLAEQLEDPSFAATYHDAAARARLIASLVGCRKDQGLRQREVAEHMGVRQSVISQFENGGGDAHLSTLQRYARAIGAQITARLEVPTHQTWADHVNRRGYTRPTTTVRQGESADAKIVGLGDWVGRARRSAA